MKEEEINIAIAEACGWNRVEGEECFFDNGSEQIYIENLPNYCNDLNAMHEAEQVLTDFQFYDFRQYLKQVTLHTKIFVEEHKRAVISATALQRAEAFLKTIGKWKE